ncbi:DUF1203 domain-containing protein [Pantoea ananatis]|uniref:DUF1203 domain-containing protein n=1 Tax=Pantoea TaxID=53335 RepID=UPI000CF3E2B4|nr:DUF1203 domain-containing protein [Pantoea ananatis]MDI6539790.1 DUF1203 domain-containing protein [Pantoea ananatis]PQK76511.1 hypothetical protein CG427_07115 [Pantoea ananatis]
MGFRISGLNPEPFTHLFGKGEHYLKQHRALRISVDSYPGYPDRISLRDIPAGETVILINHTYQPADTPYLGSHAVYLWEGCNEQGIYINKIPESIGLRLLSLRAFDENHLMLQADICEGAAAEMMLKHFFDDPSVSYIHIHNAKQGCYACLAERVL